MFPTVPSRNHGRAAPIVAHSFQLKDAKLRELGALEIVDSGSQADDSQNTKTVADFSSMATWPGDSEDELKSELAEFAEKLEREESHLVDELDDATPIEHHEPEVNELPAANEAQSGVEDDDPLTMEEPSEEESPEAAAQRIDAWFKSAKTLPDVPPLPDESVADESLLRKSKIDLLDSKYLEDREIDSIRSADDATADMLRGDMGGIEVSDDLDADSPTDKPQNIATWDDSQHMDQLLAELDDKPQEEFVASGHAEMAKTTEEHAQIADEWSPSEAVAISPMGGRRQRSIVRTLVTTVLGGFVGLALGYYALLWIFGPVIDTFNAAKYLPKAMLPSSFAKGPQVAGGPAIVQKADQTPTEPVEDATPSAGDAAEQQASFTEPVDAKRTEATGDRSGETATSAENPAAEPAAFDAPPAAPVNESVPQREPVRIKAAPSFSAADASTALQAAKDAEPGLVNGSMSDGREVAQAKGASYSKLADLAQKATFKDGGKAPEEWAKLRAGNG